MVIGRNERGHTHTDTYMYCVHAILMKNNKLVFEMDFFLVLPCLEAQTHKIGSGLTSTGSTSTPRPSRFFLTVVTSSLAK